MDLQVKELLMYWKIMVKNRIAYVDPAKRIAILLLMISHTNTFESYG